MCSGVAVGAAGIGRAMLGDSRARGPCSSQSTARRAAAGADRRADAAGRPGGELLVPAPPRGLRVDRRARARSARGRPRLRRGLRLCRARADRRRRDRRGRQSGGPRARPASLPASRTCGSSAGWSRSSREPRDAIVFLQTIEHIHEPERLLAGIADSAPLAFISTPNRLTLAPEGAEKSDNPWHLREYTAAEYRALLEPHFAEVRLLGVFHARQAARPRARPRPGLGPRPQGAADHEALLRPLHPGDRRLRLRPARRVPRTTSTAALDFVAVCRA